MLLSDPVAYELPLTTRFRGVTSRSGMLLHGAAGWGEWSPFPEYTRPEIDAWWRAAVEAAEVGWPADTPVVAISRAGWPDERFSRHTVATLAEADALHHGRPTLVTVGAGARPVLPDDAHGAHDPDQAPAPASVA